MKLHLPVKLRASLIAAVIAVSASVYNAYAYDYTNFGTQEFVQTAPALSGNTYTALENTRYWTDASKTTEVSKAADGKWYALNADGSLSDVEHTEPAGGWVTETYAGELVFAVTGSATPVTVFEGNTTLTADAVKFNNSVDAPEDGVKGVTTIEAGEVQINRNELGDPSKVNLKQLNITADATKLDKFSELNIDNSAAPGEQIDLGAVSGQGGLSIKGGTTEAGDKTAVSMDSVLMENKGTVTLDTVDAIVGGDVAVNSLTLTNSDAAVTGNVTTGGTLTVDADSKLEATGNVLTTTQQGKGKTEIDGEVISTDGNIGLDDGYISGSVTTTSTTDGKGNITLFNIVVNDGATVDASGDLTITGESTIIDNDEQDITVNAGGDLTVNDGSIIQNVDATVGGGITVDDATVDNSVITGATGDITFINGAQVTDSLINGGRHFKLDETQNDVNIDGTKIINLTGDIKLSNVTREGLELATKGTSGDNVTDYDNEVGGSIIIENSTLSHSSIKSGVQATIAEDGSISYSIEPDGTTTAASGNPAGALRVPYGHVKVTNSTLTDVTATTKRGNVTIESIKSDASLGNYTSGTIPAGNKHSEVAYFKTSMAKLGLGASQKVQLSTITLHERQDQSNDSLATDVRLVVKDANNNVVAKSQNTLDVKKNGAELTFTFAAGTVLDPSAEYIFTFENANGVSMGGVLGFASVQNNSATHYYQDGRVRHAGWSIAVKATGESYEHAILGSTVSTDNGALTMSNTYTAAADGKDTNLKASGNSSIATSMLNGGTNVEITNGDLNISGSYLLKDVNLSAKNTMTISGETVVDIDGGEAHDASVKAGNLNAGGETAVAGDTIDIANADVQVWSTNNAGEQVPGITTIYKNGTLNLTNVYKKGEGDAKDASKLGFLKADAEEDNRGTLNIESSIIEISGIRAGGSNADHFTGALDDSLSRYFGTVNVSGASDVKVTEGKALIENLNVEGSSTVSLKHAYLDTTNIDGTSKLTTGGISKLDDVNMADGATIRVTNTGDGATTLANLNQDPETTGTVTVEVVNATLQTPVVNDRVVLGLNGGTLHLKSVAAHSTVLAASVAPVANPDDLVPVRAIDPHVVLAEVTNAGGGATATSTIKTDGLNRFSTYASSTEGYQAEPKTGLYRYLYTVSADHTVAAGETLWVKDANGGWTQAAEGAVLAAGTEVSKLNYTLTYGEVQYDGTSAPLDVIDVVDVDPTLSLAEQEYLQPQKTTTWNDTVEQVVVGTETVEGVLVTYYQKVEAMPDVDFYVGYSKDPGAVEVKNDGIASLTVKGDFGADKAIINAYQLAEPVAYWKDGKAMTVSQYNALSAADKELCTPEYKPSLNVYWNIIEGPAYDALTATDLSSADKSVYTKLNPLTYTATERHELSVADYGKLTAEQQGLYVEVPGYIANNGGAPITSAQYEALSDAEKAGYTAGTIAYTNKTVKTQAEYDALTDKSGYVQLADGTWEKTNVVTIKTCVLDTFEDSSDVDAFDEDRRFFTTITEEAYNALANKDGWTMQEIQSLRDGEGYNSIFVNKNFGHDEDCCDGLEHKDLMTSDATGHIQIDGSLTGSDNELNADTTLTVGGAITGSGNFLNAGESIATGDIAGDTNTLNTPGSITAAAISGDGNNLVSATDAITVAGDVSGDANKLNAGTTVTAGSISGAQNVLTAGTTLRTGAISGAGNTLTAEESITVTSDITAGSNTLIAGTSIEGKNVSGGSNTLTAGTYVNLEGKLSGDGNTISSAGVRNNDSGIRIVSGVEGSNNTLTAETGRIVFGGDTSLNGSNNTLIAKGANANGEGITLDGAISGSNNTLRAEAGLIKTANITGDNNELKAATTIQTGAINNSATENAEGNKLTAVNRITTGALSGSNNTLEATDGQVYVQGALNGSNNTIKAAGAAADDTGANAISVWNGITGNYNTLITTSDNIASAGVLNGNNNILNAVEGNVVVGNITGASNELTAGTNVTTGTITGNSNKLTAGSTIGTGVITGNSNELTAETINTGAINGNSNELTADTINTGAINGNSNILDGETITTGDIVGDSNELTAETINTGGINGTTNVLTGTNVTVDGVLQGSDNKVTASTITVDTLAGTAQEIISTGVDKAADTAISIGTLTATDSTIEVLYPNSGSISIDTMSSKAAAGETGTTITTLAGNVTIGTLDDVTSKTSIKVGDLYGISVGSGTASNQTWVGGSLAITGTDGIALTNSTVKMLGDITGTSLSLAADAKGYTSSANNVSLSGNLVLSGNASLNITGDVESGTLSLSDSSWLKAGEVTTGTLTLVGDGVALDITKLTVTEMLDLQGGASLDGVKVNTDADGAALKVTDSALTSGMLSGFTGVTLDNSVGNLGSSSLTGMTNDVAAVNGSTLIVTSIGTSANVLADNSAITATAGISAANVTAQNKGTITTQGGNIVATGTVTADNGEIKTNGGDITANSMVITKGGEISADDVILSGALDAAKGTLKADSVTGATSATLNGATIAGALSMADGDGADVTATNGTTIGSIANADAVTLEGASKVTGNVGMSGALNMGGESAIGGKVSGATSATLNNADITGSLGMNGKLTMTDASVGSVSGATSATLTGDSTITGALAMQGDNADVNAQGGSIDSITGANDVTTTDTTMGAVSMNGKLTMTNGTATSVSGANGAELKDATITGALNAAGGTIEADGGSIGSITGGATTVDLDGTQIGDIDMATTGTLIVKDTTTGVVNDDADNTVYNATLTNATIGSGLYVTNDMTSNGTVTVGGAVTVGHNLAVNAGTLTANSVAVTGKTTLTDAIVNADTFTTGELALESINGVLGELVVNNDAYIAGTELKVTDSITVNGKMDIVENAKVTNDGNATITGDLTVSDSIFTNVGEVKVGGAASVTDGGVLTGTSLSADSVTVEAGSITGDVKATDGDVTVEAGSITGDVTASAAVTVNKGTITGSVTATGTVKLTDAETGTVGTTGDVEADGATINGTVTGAAVTLDGSVAGAVTATGAATLSNATINGALSAADTVVSNVVTVNGAADVDGLTVNKGATLTAAEGLTADGKLDIQSAVTATKGNVALTGAEGSTIAANVTAAAGDVIIAGTVAATEAALKGANVTINGTLDAGKGVSFIGKVNGSGTIVKTSGDTLALAGDTKIGGVTVKGSTLAVDGGAELGKLTVSDKSTVEIAGEDMGTVKVAAGSSIKDSTVMVDLSLNAKTRTAINGDLIDGSIKLDNAIVDITRADIDENSVKDQDKYKLATGTVTGEFAVKHDLDTLNVHTEGGNLVFSKNFKGAENKTANQAATADALTSLGDKPAGALADVMAALKSTRSEAEALKALDSLGGAGLSAAPKLIADETKEHLQTLRSTLQSVAAGLERRYTASGLRLDSIESTGVTASVTGGSSTVKEDGNAPEYSRNSVGAMLTTAHAINDEWVFGAALSFSQADADCGATTIESQGVFVDVGVMQKRGRFSQMGSIGCAFFSMDTERTSLTGTGEGSTDAAAFTMTYETTYAIWQTETYSFSSVVMAEMLFAQVDNMEEEGLGNAGLRSSFDDVASFTFGAGARYTLHFGEETNPGYLSLEAMAVADTGDSTTKVNNTFIGGGNSFQLSGPEAGNYGLRLNAGVLVPLGDQWGLFGNATGEFRSEQSTVGGSVGVKCTF